MTQSMMQQGTIDYRVFEYLNTKRWKDTVPRESRRKDKINARDNHKIKIRPLWASLSKVERPIPGASII